MKPVRRRMVTRGRSNIVRAYCEEPGFRVIASDAKQSRTVYGASGLPRGFAARNDDSFDARINACAPTHASRRPDPPASADSRPGERTGGEECVSAVRFRW